MSKEYTERAFPEMHQLILLYKLHEQEESPIKTVDRVVLDKNRFYLLDRKTNALFIYSRKDGNLLQVINRVGTDTGEFTSLHDFDVDKESGEIIVLDGVGQKLIFYSQDGEYIKEIKPDFFTTGFKLDTRGNILLYNENPSSKKETHYLKRIDRQGKEIGMFFSVDSSISGTGSSPKSPLQVHGDEAFYLPGMSNTIYSLEQDKPVLTYLIDLGTNWPGKEEYEKMREWDQTQVRSYMLEKGYATGLNFALTDEVVHIGFITDTKYSFFYNKRTGQSLLINMEYDDLNFPLATEGNQFVGVRYKEEGKVQVAIYTVDFNWQ